MASIPATNTAIHANELEPLSHPQLAVFSARCALRLLPLIKITSFGGTARGRQYVDAINVTANAVVASIFKAYDTHDSAMLEAAFTESEASLATIVNIPKYALSTIFSARRVSQVAPVMRANEALICANSAEDIAGQGTKGLMIPARSAARLDLADLQDSTAPTDIHSKPLWRGLPPDNWQRDVIEKWELELNRAGLSNHVSRYQHYLDGGTIDLIEIARDLKDWFDRRRLEITGTQPIAPASSTTEAGDADLTPIREEEFEGLSRRAIIAFAVRCALRVQPLVRTGSFNGQEEAIRHLEAINAAIYSAYLTAMGKGYGFVDADALSASVSAFYATDADKAAVFAANVAAVAAVAADDDDKAAVHAANAANIAYAALDGNDVFRTIARKSARDDLNWLKVSVKVRKDNKAAANLLKQPLWSEPAPTDWKEQIVDPWRDELVRHESLEIIPRRYLELSAGSANPEDIANWLRDWLIHRPPTTVEPESGPKRKTRSETSRHRQIETGKTEESPTPPVIMETGGRVSPTREAPLHGACLKAPDYAKAIAHLFRRAQGDFNFGLFGHWGRGKTYMMKLVEQELIATQENDASERPLKYEVVKLSAWAYPQTPHLWAHLYEAIARCATRAGPIRSLPLSLRAALIRHGTWAFIGAIFLFGLGLLPINLKINAILNILSIVGLGGLLYLVRLGRAGGTLVGRLSTLLSLPRHEEHLGLQAAIGRDFKALLQAWIVHPALPPGSASASQTGTPTIEPPVSDPLAQHATWYKKYIYVFVNLIVFYLLVPSISHFSEQASWIAWILAIGWLVISLCAGQLAITDPASLAWCYSPFKKTPLPDRVLLIVDDLDRCDLEQLLVVMEGLKQFLESAEVSQRLQVAMLVDDRVLSRAILKKYGQLATSANDPPPPLSAPQIVLENIEKLFLAYLRLSDLDASEVDEAAEQCFRELHPAGTSMADKTDSAESLSERSPEESRAPSATGGEGQQKPSNELPDPNEPIESSNNEISAKQPIRPQPETPQQPAVQVHKIDPTLELTLGEGDAIKAAVKKFVANEIPRRVGPRTVRSFIFRYQLARLLLQRLGESPDPQQLIEAIVNAEMKASGQGNSSDLLTKIAGEVAIPITSIPQEPAVAVTSQASALPQPGAGK